VRDPDVHIIGLAELEVVSGGTVREDFAALMKRKYPPAQGHEWEFETPVWGPDQVRARVTVDGRRGSCHARSLNSEYGPLLCDFLPGNPTSKE
jgi:hypothetical protein